jgi:hypothetical protein
MPLNATQEQMLDFNSRIIKALNIAFENGQADGAHHKAWIIDQMVRALTDTTYAEWVAKHNAGEEGPNTYTWDVGIAP